MARAATSPAPAATRAMLVGIVIVAAVIHLWGIRQDLPFATHVDEPIFVAPAVRMASSGDLNPHWFGHPGSTVIYPLAAALHAWSVLRGGPVLAADPTLQQAFAADQATPYLLGRLLAIAYAVMSVPLVYLLGRCAFGPREGLIGAWLYVFHPVAVTHAVIVRTDSAATFFGLLALWLCLRALDRGSVGSLVLAGAAIGLATASRYFMVTLLAMFFATAGVLVRRTSGDGRRPWLAIGAGLGSVVAAFAIATPYLFLDFQAAVRSIVHEGRGTHLGADGLSPLGNAIWYLTDAIPGAATWPQVAFFVAGGAVAVRAREPRPVMLLAFLVVFLLATSLSRLHWQRWMIEILPVLALFAAHGLVFMVERQMVWPAAGRVARTAAIVLLVGMLSFRPAVQSVADDRRRAAPSTRILAREWMVAHLPRGTVVATEWYGAPLAGTGLAVRERFALAQGHTRADDYAREGCRHLVVSSSIYGRFLAERARYPAQTGFYEDLFARGRLLQEWVPGRYRGGPVIRLYELPGE